ncbi:MAG: TolC family protein [Bacteroidota bacterium]
MIRFATKVVLLLVLLCPVLAFSQVKLTLEDCIAMALESNLQLRQSGNSLSAEQVALTRSKFDFLPSAVALFNGSRGFGRTVDNFTQAIADSPTTMNGRLGVSLDLFRGFSKWNELRRAENAVKAAQYSLEDLENDIRLNVALAFFNATYAEDNLAVADGNLDLLEKQLERARAMQEAGMNTQGDLFAVEAEIANAKAAVVSAQNNYDRSLLDLLLALNADMTKTYTLVRPDLEGLVLADEMRSAESVYEYAQQNNPAVREQQMRIIAANYALKQSQSGFFPTLSLDYTAFTFFSSNARPLDSVLFTDDGFQQFFGPTTPFDDQVTSNFSHSLGLTLTIPLFSKYSVYQGVANARLNYSNAQLNYDNAQNELYRAVMQAHQDAMAARAQYLANVERAVSQQKALEYAEQKYESGVMDFYSLREFINNDTQARVDRIRTQYDYVLKQKVLDLYEGKQLKF